MSLGFQKALLRAQVGDSVIRQLFFLFFEGFRLPRKQSLFFNLKPASFRYPSNICPNSNCRNISKKQALNTQTNTQSSQVSQKILNDLKTILVQIDPSADAPIVQPDRIPPPEQWKLGEKKYITLSGYKFTMGYGVVPTEELRDKMVNAVEGYFQSNGFAKDVNNPSQVFDAGLNNFDTFSKYLAYSKNNNLFCTLRFEGGIFFRCGTQDNQTDLARKEFEDTIYNTLGRNAYFSIKNMYGGYALIQTIQKPPVQDSKDDIILKKENDVWKFVANRPGNVPPPCSFLDDNKIPRKLYDGCFSPGDKEFITSN